MKKIKLELIIVLLTAVFLYFWQIQKRQYFSYDQARDYLIVKKIILDQKFTLVGPTVLTPGVFLPPFYYYSLILPLWLFNFHLIGPDLYTVFLGIIAIGVFYLLVKDLFGKQSALLSSLVFGLNPYLIQASRHAWNPNTIYLFSLIFVLSFERYFLKKKSFYLVLASFAFSWALNLHYTIVVFLPILIFLFYKEVKNKLFSRNFWESLVTFLFFVFPIALFELRHNFPNLNGVAGFITNEVNYWEKINQMLVDYLKMPLVLLSGVNQGQNLSVNPSHIVLLDKINLVFDIKTGLGLAVVAGIILFLIFNIKKASNKLKMILLFLFFGFAIRLVFPPGSFYFYHYTFLFPFIFLVLGFIFAQIIKRNKKLAVVLAVFTATLPLYGSSLKNEVKDEKSFLPSVKVIARDAGKENVAVAANLSDIARWDHNGLEYRYFLESVYKLPPVGWEAGDYKKANVLYLIDEGDLKEPLKLGGMEGEAFRPAKIENVWKVETRQTVYKLIK